MLHTYTYTVSCVTPYVYAKAGINLLNKLVIAKSLLSYARLIIIYGLI